jgi:N-acetyl-anhydromuramyl-L-alanine amidase AmpD
MDPGGYDAYRPHRHFDPDQTLPRDSDDVARYHSFRRNLPPGLEGRVKREGWRVEDLRRVVRKVVLHYDAAGSSRRCFEILHDVRGLSAHFLLDTDGTIFQTLDVKERAWHAGKANDHTVGIEIANLGAYEDPGRLEGATVKGTVHGQTLYQLPYTDAQYEALADLLAALCRVLAIPPDSSGIIGHSDLTRSKVDPGPALDWERLFTLLRAR